MQFGTRVCTQLCNQRAPLSCDTTRAVSWPDFGTSLLYSKLHTVQPALPVVGRAGTLDDALDRRDGAGKHIE